MDTVERQLITIVAEAVVERRLVEDVKKCGAKGYSLGHVTGEGVTGRHSLDLNGPSVRLELLARDYFERFAVVAWITPARVARPDRF
jgi:hypothetical protein